MSAPSGPEQPNYGGPEQPNYGGLPNFPSAPPPMDTPRQQFTPPNEIMSAFWCYVAGALILVVSGVLTITQRQQLISTLHENNPQHLTDAQINTVITATIVATVVILVIVAALYVLFAFKLRQGRNWARIVLTVVAALALLSLLATAGGGTFLSLIGDLAAVAGCVLSYLPKSNAYIGAVRAARSGL
jgi:hypothetical protein